MSFLVRCACRVDPTRQLRRVVADFDLERRTISASQATNSISEFGAV
jgi:hypothetical protein